VFAGSTTPRPHAALAGALALAVAVVAAMGGCGPERSGRLVDAPPPLLLESGPAWSPDGSSLAFIYSPQVYGQQLQLWTFRFADSALAQFGVGWAPAWSHDGQTIAYTNGGLLLVYHVAPHSTDVVWGVGPLARPSWSPDDRWIAVDRVGFDSLDGIWACATFGDSAVRLLPSGSRQPQWSPDSSRIVFMFMTDASYEIAVLHLATGRIDTLTRDANDDRDPAWSNDSQWIAWSRHSASADPFHVWIMRADGSAKRDLQAPGMQPAWSPDGSRIAYAAYDAAKNEYLLHTMARDGTGDARLLAFWHGD
jgi:Tol biopolymer transport system component